MGASEHPNQHSKELKINSSESLKLTLSILLALYIINLLRDPKKKQRLIEKNKNLKLLG